MGPLRLPNEEEICTAYDEGKESFITLFNETFLKIKERIQKLEDQLA